MHLGLRTAMLVLGCCLALGLPPTAHAGMLGYPVPRLQPLHLRVELAGDSFKEEIDGLPNALATTGRGLVSIALGLTEWSEVYARLGIAEFNVNAAEFRGGFGFAYGGGARVRLFQVPWGSLGLAGQYLRFTNRADDIFGNTVQGSWEEIDVALGFGSRRFSAFQVYTGAAYHHTNITLRNTETRVRTELETRIPARFFIGLHIYPLGEFPGGEFVVNVEARLIGETPQVTLGIQYSF